MVELGCKDYCNNAMSDFTNYIIILLPVSCQLAERAIFSHQGPITRLAGHSLPACRGYGLLCVLQSNKFSVYCWTSSKTVALPEEPPKTEKKCLLFFLLSQNVCRTTIIQVSEVGNERRFSCAETRAKNHLFRDDCLHFGFRGSTN